MTDFVFDVIFNEIAYHTQFAIVPNKLYEVLQHDSTAFTNTHFSEYSISF